MVLEFKDKFFSLLLVVEWFSPFRCSRRKTELSTYGISLPQEPRNTKKKSFVPKC